MQYAIFPMKNVNITTTYNSEHYAWDIAGKGTDAEYWRAPCTIKVLKILSQNEGYNTVLFGTCDNNGNKTSVMCADGVQRVLTFACTHMDSLDRFGLKEDKIYQSGDVCYQEGNFGNSNGNHVHMEVGIDWIYSKGYTDNQWVLLNPSNVIEKTFYLLNGWNEIYNLKHYTLPYVNARENTTPVDPSPNGKCMMKLYGSAARLRDNVVNGNIKTTIPNGTEFEVIGLYSWNASDGYKWGYGKWNGIEGYFQYDPQVMMPLGNNLEQLNFKMTLFNSAARIRTKPVNGEILTTVPNGNNIQIIQFGNLKESDGFQWFRGSYNGVVGFLQYDPTVMFPTND